MVFYNSAQPVRISSFRKHPEQFDLVITDMTMPDITGIELAEKIAGIRPDIPIILFLCTGFTEKISAESSTMFGIKGYIMKPYTQMAVAKKIKEILNVA